MQYDQIETYALQERETKKNSLALVRRRIELNGFIRHIIAK